MAAPSAIEKMLFERSTRKNQVISIPGSEHPLSVRKTTLPSAKATPAEFLSLATLGRAAQFIAHDFRHHLSIVYANAEFIGSRSMDPGEREELLSEIRIAIDCMTDQLDSLLLFTRTGCALQMTHQSLKSIVERAIQMVHAHPEARQVEIFCLDLPPIEACVDGLRLCSAIFNLLLNACQSANAVGEVNTVNVVLNQNKQYIFIRVLDRGPGVPPAIRETLFQPFVKTEGGKGSGFGLTIARCVAREHGGDVYLETSRPGKTAFVLRLSKPALKALSTAPHTTSIA
jgi:signal transduction histidine kinase